MSSNHGIQFTDQVIVSLQQKYYIEVATAPDPFYSLLELIISQQLSVKAADTIVQRFVDVFAEDGITPEKVLQIPLEQLRSLGISWSKAQYLKNIAEAVIAGSLKFEMLPALSDEEVITVLTAIKGIGRWTAEMFLMFTLGRPDVMSYGDVGLQNAIQRLYGFKEKPTQAEMEIISNQWKPYRTYACKLLWKSLENTSTLS